METNFADLMKQDAGAINREFSISCEGILLHAKMNIPPRQDEAAVCPLMIIIHGFTGHMEEAHLVAVTNQMLSMGVAVLRVDMYGHGKSGGEFYNHTLLNWISETLKAVDYAREQGCFSPIILCGHSQGGLMAMMAAGMKHEDINAAVLLAPAYLIPDAARAGKLFGLTIDPRHVPEEFCVWDAHLLSGNYCLTAQLLHPEESVRAYDGPVLIVQDTEDDPYLMEYSKKAAGEYANARYVEIPGDTHDFEYHKEEMAQAVGRFVRRILSEQQEISEK